MAKSTNMILGGDNSLEGWRELDEKVTLASSHAACIVAARSRASS